MPEFTQGHSRQWTEYFAGRGHSARPLAAGVEGAVYDLGDGRIAKVWRRRGVAELEGRQRLYADVMDARLPFGTPEILAVEYVNGTPVTYERKLPGQPLQDQLAVEAYAVAPAAARCVIDVLQALAAVPASTAMRQLAVLDEGQPLWAGAQTFRAALMNLLRRRVTRFGAVLRRRMPDFDLCYAGYAVATANAFTADGSDGHFAWCISQLRRPDIAAALGL